MILRKGGLCLITLLVVIISCFSAAAVSISDPANDVWHWSEVGTAGSWTGNVADKPSIDIRQIGYTVDGNNLTITITVTGPIESSEKVVYWVYYNSTDTAYFMYWSNGTGTGFAIKQGGGGYESATNFAVTTDTISAEFTVLGDTSNVELWGWAVQYTTYGDQTKEWWGDWAPDAKFPYAGQTGGNTTGGNNNNGGSTSGTKTPGFEIVPLIAAVAITAILLKKRRY